MAWTLLLSPSDLILFSFQFVALSVHQPRMLCQCDQAWLPLTSDHLSDISLNIVLHRTSTQRSFLIIGVK